MTFKEFFQEAIALSTAKKKYTSKQSPHYQNPSEKVKALFGDKHRLVFPIEITDLDEAKNHQLFEKIRDFLESKNYSLESFSDYVKGVTYQNKNGKPDTKNPMKIGRVLEKEEPMGEIEINQRTVDPGTGEVKREKKIVPGKPLAHEFKMDPTRLQGKNFVVISRHPYDIAGMSTDRNWTSCMDLGPKIEYKDRKEENGLHSDYVKEDIASGSLIAYLVSDKDRTPGGDLAIRRPIGRILMKPFVSEDGSKIAYSVGKIYGAGGEAFKSFISKWVEDFNGKLEGEYKLHPNLYNDYDVLPGKENYAEIVMTKINELFFPDELEIISFSRNIDFSKAATEPVKVNGVFMTYDDKAINYLRKLKVPIYKQMVEYGRYINSPQYLSKMPGLNSVREELKTITGETPIVDFIPPDSFAFRFSFPLDFRGKQLTRDVVENEAENLYELAALLND